MLDLPRFLVSRNKVKSPGLSATAQLHRLYGAEGVEPHIGGEPLEDVGLGLDREDARLGRPPSAATKSE